MECPNIIITEFQGSIFSYENNLLDRILLAKSGGYRVEKVKLLPFADTKFSSWNRNSPDSSRLHVYLGSFTINSRLQAWVVCITSNNI